MQIRSIINITLIILLCFTTTVLANNKANDDNYHYAYYYATLNQRCAVYDPYETLNRKIFIFNGILDTFLLRPIAKGYGKFTNDYSKSRIGSFVDNINEPLSSINYIMQGKFQGAFKTFWRFAINSTFGLGGLFDVASKLRLTAEPQTFANILAHYGVGAGPYLVLPIYGGMSARDAMNPLAMNIALNPIQYFVHQDFNHVLNGVQIIHKRNQIMPFTDHITQNSTDTYISVRDAILNQRESKMIYPVGFTCPTMKNR